jgi:hypothetical protein
MMLLQFAAGAEHPPHFVSICPGTRRLELCTTSYVYAYVEAPWSYACQCLDSVLLPMYPETPSIAITQCPYKFKRRSDYGDQHFRKAGLPTLKNFPHDDPICGS